MLEVRQCRQCLSFFFFLFFLLICWQDGIKPMWEDDRNRRGGRWLITLSKQQRKSDLDRFWLETVRSVPSLRASDSEQNALGQSHLVAVLITKHLETRWHSRRNTDAINRTWTWASYGFTRRCSVSTAAIVAVLLLRLAVLLKKKMLTFYFPLINNTFLTGSLFFPLQLLCLVGEAFDDYSDDVCGAVINVRTKGDKIAVWTTNYENKEAITHIG